MTTEGLTKEQLDDLKNAFESTDEDGDEKITSKQFIKLLVDLDFNAPEKDELAVLEKDIDHQYGGKLTFEQFVPIISSFMQATIVTTGHETLCRKLKPFDKDNDGYMSAVELKNAISELKIEIDAKEVDKAIQELDDIGDGSRIHYEEFVTSILPYV